MFILDEDKATEAMGFDDIMAGVMETTLDTQEVVEEGQPEPTKEVEKKDGGKAEGDETTPEVSDTVDSQPEEKGTKALIEKLKKKDEIIKLLQAEKKEAKPSSSDLEKLAELADIPLEDLKAKMMEKEAKKAGMSLESYMKTQDMETELETFRSEKAEKAETARVEKVEKIVEAIAEMAGDKVEAEDITTFFENVKSKHNIDLRANPDVELAKALISANAGESLKEKIKQDTLAQVREGKIAEPKSTVETPQTKKQKQTDEEMAGLQQAILEALS